MPLVNPVDITDEQVKELVNFFNETLGFCPNSVLTMQRRPAIAKAFVELNMAVMQNHGDLTPEFKRLIAFVTSNTAGCRYCQAHTIRAAERYGSSRERLENVWDFENQNCFSDKEKAALRFAQEAAMVPVNVAEETENQLHIYWSNDDIVEIYEHCEYNHETEICDIIWEYRYQKHLDSSKQFEYQMRMYYPDTINRLLIDNGFYIDEAYGDYDMNRFKEDSQLQIYKAI